MNLSSLKPVGAIAKVASRQALHLQKNAPNLMFAGGVAGVVATTILACRATLKLESVLDEAEGMHAKANEARRVAPQAYSEADRKKDHVSINVMTAVKITKIYAPALAVGVVSVGLLTRSHMILNQRNAALGAAYTALDTGFKEYRARVVKELGEDKDLEFRHGTAVHKETVETANGSKTIESNVIQPVEGSIYGRFFDDSSTSWSREPFKNLVFLKSNQNYANDKLRMQGHLFLNEVYDMLGLERSIAGQQVGWLWDGDGDNYVDFGIFDGNNDLKRHFINGHEKAIYLDFNVDGVIFHLLGRDS